MSSNAPSVEQAMEAARLAGLLPTAEEDARNAAAIEQRQIESDVADMVAGLEEAVEEGVMTPAEAAAGLYAQADISTRSGKNDPRALLAHQLFTDRWRAREHVELLEDAQNELMYADAETYAKTVDIATRAERDRIAAELQAARAAQEQQKLDEAEAALRAHGVTLDRGTLAAHVGQNADLDVNELARRTAHEVRAVEQAEAAIRAQVDAEWRAQRRDKGATSPLVTAADIANHERIYKAARFDQLKQEKLEEIRAKALTIAPMAEDELRAQSERIAARNDRSQSFANHVGEIDKRGREAEVTRDRGEGIAEEKRAYREALARAEANAEVVTEGSIPSGYRGPGSEPRRQQDPRLPAGWVDEYGPAF